MVIIEVEPNSNCEASDLRVFNDVEAPRPVAKVCLEREPGKPEWYDVTGWTATGKPVAALAQRVDDSGEGLAVLVHGADAGLRLKPSGSSGAWSAEDARQWGEPFLLLANDGRSIIYT